MEAKSSAKYRRDSEIMTARRYTHVRRPDRYLWDVAVTARSDRGTMTARRLAHCLWCSSSCSRSLRVPIPPDEQIGPTSQPATTPTIAEHSRDEHEHTGHPEVQHQPPDGGRPPHRRVAGAVEAHPLHPPGARLHQPGGDHLGLAHAPGVGADLQDRRAPLHRGDRGRPGHEPVRGLQAPLRPDHLRPGLAERCPEPPGDRPAAHHDLPGPSPGRREKSTSRPRILSGHRGRWSWTSPSA